MRAFLNACGARAKEECLAGSATSWCAQWRRRSSRPGRSPVSATGSPSTWFVTTTTQRRVSPGAPTAVQQEPSATSAGRSQAKGRCLAYRRSRPHSRTYCFPAPWFARELAILGSMLGVWEGLAAGGGDQTLQASAPSGWRGDKNTQMRECCIARLDGPWVATRGSLKCSVRELHLLGRASEGWMAEPLWLRAHAGSSTHVGAFAGVMPCHARPTWLARARRFSWIGALILLSRRCH